jgi:Transposase IS66 family
LDALLLAMQATAILPKSIAGKAVSYTLTRWEKLTRFIEHPVIESSTNWAENSMRPVAIAQRSKEAGPKSAAFFSIVESCRKLDVPILKYLAELLPGLADPASSLWPNSPRRPTAPKRQRSLSPAAQSRQRMVLDGSNSKWSIRVNFRWKRLALRFSSARLAGQLIAI